MRERTVWLGTPGDVVQVKCPSSGLTKTPTSWNTSGTYLSGGGFARSSGVTHQEYAISWGGDSVENFATLLTQLSKQEPIYYLDPLECKTNLLPPYVAQYVRGNPLKSSPVNTGTGVNGYPNTASSYQYDTQVFTTPVPEGFRLWVGAHGTGGLSVERLVPQGNTVTALPPSSNVRVNASFSGGTTYTLTVLGGSLLNGIIAQILPDEETPTTGGFLPGMGHSMLSLNGDVSITEYSAALENYQMALTANFIETGAWN